MNKVIITGNVTANPEAHTTQNGIARSNFTVAVQRKFKNANGEREADFINVVAWRGTADFCNRYITKGRKVCVEGSLQVRSYEKDGVKHYITEIVADTVETLDKGDNAGGSAKPARKQSEAPAEPEDFTEVSDEGLPF